MSQNARPVLIFFDGTPLQIEQITAIAQQQAQAALSPEPAFRERIQKGADFLDRLLAEDGVVYGEAGKVVKVAGFTVPVVDTTGAGDTFNGAFAAARCEGLTIKEAIRFANAAAALSVGKIGAQGGMPWRKEVEEMLSCRK